MNSSEVLGAWPPPPGVTPNFDNPDSIAWRVITAALISPVVSIFFVLMRSYTKRFIFHRFDWDDYAVIIAFVFAFAYSVLQVVQTQYGSGVHIWNVPLEKYTIYTKLGIPGAVTYNMSTLFTKVAILLFYLRLSTDFHFRCVTYAVMFVAVGYSLAGGFAFLYLCRPLPKYWDFSIPGECSNFGAAFLAGAALNVATDISLLLLPLWLLHPLKLPLKQKIGVTLILMTGSFVCGVSIYRLAIIPPGLKNMDATWHYIRNIIWCIIEMNTGIICACLPNLKAFAKRHFPNLFKRPAPALVRPTGYMQRPSPQSQVEAQGNRTRWLKGYFSMNSLKSSNGSSSSIKKSAATVSTIISAPKTRSESRESLREQLTV
ncbi:hypothetical protein ONS95_005188 [Cadophora gregata]|uniref:uncharacterized protein n=1 Tax=Cadophora gregata TaxID=51156 RepID=UPI0026DD04E3|nr:uncharacterized protein ONS95_005188 [Cadophora gregata]KAK0104925.1 hypothetical protein ONS95_005188 [Cadophora gregata]